VLLKPPHGRVSDLGRKKKFDAVRALAEETERLESPSAVEERGLLRGSHTEALDVRGQLAVEEAHGIATLRCRQSPSSQRRLTAAEEQRFRR
jgi:hypothetical protein